MWKKENTKIIKFFEFFKDLLSKMKICKGKVKKNYRVVNFDGNDGVITKFTNKLNKKKYIYFQNFLHTL